MAGITKMTLDDLMNDIKEGLTNKEIAEKHELTEQGVKQRIYYYCKKYGVKKRYKLIDKYFKRSVLSECCPKCGNCEYDVYYEGSDDFSFWRECVCMECGCKFRLEYDLKLTSICSSESLDEDSESLVCEEFDETE